MEFTPIINVDRIKDIIATQYKESEKFIEYISALLSTFDELEQVFADILNTRMFDNAEGDVLDIYGIILGKNRTAYDTGSKFFFGLDADDVNNPVFHGGLGTLGDPIVGGVFRSLYEGLDTKIYLDDPLYKKILVSRIHKNNYKGGYNALIEAIEAIFGVTEKGAIEINENFDDLTDPYVDINLYLGLTVFEETFLTVLDILPRPGGIRYEYNFFTDSDFVLTEDGLNTQTSDNLDVLSILLEGE